MAVAIVASSWLRISTFTTAMWTRLRSTRVSTTSPRRNVASPVSAGLRYWALEWVIVPHSPAHAAT